MYSFELSRHSSPFTVIRFGETDRYRNEGGRSLLALLQWPRLIVLFRRSFTNSIHEKNSWQNWICCRCHRFLLLKIHKLAKFNWLPLFCFLTEILFRFSFEKNKTDQKTPQGVRPLMLYNMELSNYDGKPKGIHSRCLICFVIILHCSGFLNSRDGIRKWTWHWN